MAKIPFDIKYRPRIESGEYKVFAHEHDEQETRIVCWDNKGEYPIVALVDNEPEKFDKHGRVPGGNRGGEFDLFIVTPEEELSEFEQACMKLYNEGCDDGLSGDKLSNESVKESASELFSLAINARAKELSEGLKQSKLDKDSIHYHLIEFMCNLYTCQNWKEIEETAELYAIRLKAAAMKDLPRWKEYATAGMQKRELSLTLYSGVYEVSDLFIDRGLYIPISDLEKLPGFKEDEK